MSRKVVLRLAGLLVIWSSCAAAQAPTSSDRPAGKALAPVSDADEAGIRQRVDQWLRSCLANWEKDTHMTRSEWQATCERVAKERSKALMDEKMPRKAD